MSLMDRIKVKPFLTFTYSEKLDLIKSVQQMRINSLEEARTKKARGRTKSAIKNLKKRGKTVVDPAKVAEKAMAKLTPMQIKKLMEMYE